MSSQIQTSLKADCVAYEGTPELDNLGENIQLLCEAKKSKIKPKKFSLREYYNTVSVLQSVGLAVLNRRQQYNCHSNKMM